MISIFSLKNVCLIILFIISLLSISYAENYKYISINNNFIDISKKIQLYLNYGRIFNIYSVPDEYGVIRRIAIQSKKDNTTGNWAVFSIKNITDKKIKKIIVSPHYTISNSYIFNKKNIKNNIYSIITSTGIYLNKQKSKNFDIFEITINPNSIITLITELGKNNFFKLYLFDQKLYEKYTNLFNIYYGFLFGISLLIFVIFVTILILKRNLLLLKTLNLSFSIIFNIYINFFDTQDLINIPLDTEYILRNIGELLLAGNILIFLYTYIYKKYWYDNAIYNIALWMIISFAIYFCNPILFSIFSRISLFIVACITTVNILYLFIIDKKKYTRNIEIIPIWTSFLFWIIIFYFSIFGLIDQYFVEYILSGILLIILIFTMILEVKYFYLIKKRKNILFNNISKHELAIIGANNIIWDWNVIKDHISTYPDISSYIGIPYKQINSSINNWMISMHSEDIENFRVQFSAVLKSFRGKLNTIFRLRSGDERYYWFKLHARPCIDDNGTIVRFIGMMVDITKIKNSEENILKNSIYDTLTGFPNKNLFIEYINIYHNLVKLRKKINITVIVLDFDNFNNIGKNYGLSIEDTFILSITNRIKNKFNIFNIYCRLSTDRFAFFLTKEGKKNKIINIVNTLHKLLSLPIIISNRVIKITNSIGLVSISNNDYFSSLDLLNLATIAMYQAKLKGGNNIIIYNKKNINKYINYNFIKYDLETAIEKNELNLVYQPIMSILGKNIVGLSVSLQWCHPIHGIIQMKDFIIAAENKNLLQKIIILMFSKIMKEKSIIYNKYKNNIFFLINIPKYNIFDKDFFDIFFSTIMKYPCKDGEIMISISYESISKNKKIIFSIFKQIKKFGFKLVLNDININNNIPLNYLCEFPFDIININYSFIRSTKLNKLSALKYIIKFAHSIGMQVIADGVENKETKYMLKSLNCEYLISYYNNKFMTIEEIISNKIR